MDLGSQRSLLPPASMGMSSEGRAILSAAIGSSILTFGTRLVTISFHWRHFEWDFVVGPITVRIISLDFLCANRMRVELNHRLIDSSDLIESFITFPCEIGGARPLTQTNFLGLGDVFYSCLFHQHGVEHSHCGTTSFHTCAVPRCGRIGYG